MSWETCPTCPVCPWSSCAHPRQLRAAAFADHVAEHSMFEVVVALIAALQRKPAAPVAPKACPKVGYPDDASAARALLSAWRKATPRRREARTYHCSRCDYWHLTSKPLLP